MVLAPAITEGHSGAKMHIPQLKRGPPPQLMVSFFFPQRYLINSYLN